ncbi:hypothetical protein CCR95_16905 [Thiocystis minor]|uniref:hypothetical protein n=1 Tax=Thiocystis minor TaxID=61597 RepID=UPI001912A6E1|nr:hypothetical protein [Thiocystis minor]MBK5965714.1 hypothetical protein [Thiocystis minor]
MSIADLIRKTRAGDFATATVATVATHSPQKPVYATQQGRTVAPVADVAVANPRNAENAIAANDDPEPVKIYRLFVITRPNSEQFSLSRTPPATLAEIQADYPDCRIEPIPDPPPAAALADDDKALALALLDHWQEDDPDTRRGWLDGLRDPERLAGMRAMAHALGVAVAVTLPPDDRRTCRQCRNLSRNGRCQAAEAGRLPLTGTRYEPDQNALQRCVGYAPGADDPDRRPGKERFPGLHARLWATARAPR